MPEVHPKYEDEIDLIDILKTLWLSKKVISIFIILALLIGSGFLFLKDPSYESRLTFDIGDIPPFYDEEKVSAEFINLFYSRKTFEEWKKNVGNTSLIFKDFVHTEVFDGFTITRDKDDQFVEFSISKNINAASYFLVKTNQLKLLNSFLSYAFHINETLKTNYITRAKQELDLIEKRFIEADEMTISVVDNILSIDRFIDSINKGANVININPPSKPKRVSLKPSFVITLSILLGGLIGLIYVFILNILRKTKERLTKT
jgi:LPS O-antigen subunit length determinant protein (WzzB/FepE family)